jgi:hypothetical protein
LSQLHSVLGNETTHHAGNLGCGCAMQRHHEDIIALVDFLNLFILSLCIFLFRLDDPKLIEWTERLDSGHELIQPKIDRCLEVAKVQDRE